MKKTITSIIAGLFLLFAVPCAQAYTLYWYNTDADVWVEDGGVPIEAFAEASQDNTNVFTFKILSDWGSPAVQVDGVTLKISYFIFGPDSGQGELGGSWEIDPLKSWEGQWQWSEHGFLETGSTDYTLSLALGESYPLTLNAWVDPAQTGVSIKLYAGFTLPEEVPVPIPGAAWLLGSGLIGLAGLRRRLFN